MTVILVILIQSNDVLAKQAQPSLVVAINHYPPWTDTSVEPFAGIDTEFIRQLASELSATISFVACPLKRCLVLMEQGQADMMIGLFKSPEREIYMYYLEPAYSKDQPKAFYLRQDANFTIEQYQDLASLKIGVKRGASYFEPFDDDKSLDKMSVNDEIQLVQLLVHERIDTFIGSKIIFDHVIKQVNPSKAIVRAHYRPQEGDLSYVTLSRKSLWTNKKSVVEQALAKLLSDGTYQRTLSQYLTPQLTLK